MFRLLRARLLCFSIIVFGGGGGGGGGMTRGARGGMKGVGG
jgi:hypothetical protein